MTDITIALSDLNWESGQGAHTVGQAFLDDDLQSSSDLHRSFRSVSSFAAFRELVSELNGQFAVIVNYGDEVWMGADHIRTHPLFYAVEDDAVYVGDNFPAIDDAIEFAPPDRLSCMEFIVTGYPSGSNTLHPEIQKMRAGEVLRINTTSRAISVHTDQYFRYRADADPIYSKMSLYKKMDRVLARVFDRTIQIAEGRPILLPLSGGYDSRLIGLMLRDRGYNNVQTYCHNRQESEDIRVSQIVADDLNYDWTELTFTDSDIHSIQKSSRYRKIRDKVGNFGTIQPSPTTLLIVNEIQERKGTQSSSFSLIGHTAAAPGGFMPSVFDSLSNFTEYSAIQAILDYHYNKIRWNRRRYGSLFKNRIMSELPYSKINGFDEGIDAIEYWYWQERIPNRLLTPPQMLQEFNQERWYPLWDKEFTQLFSLMNTDMRINKSLYHDFIKWKYEQVGGDWRQTDKELQTSSTVRNLNKSLISYIMGSQAEPIARSLNFYIDTYLFYNPAIDLGELASLNVSTSRLDNELASRAYLHLKDRINQN